MEANIILKNISLYVKNLVLFAFFKSVIHSILIVNSGCTREGLMFPSYLKTLRL